MDRTLFWNRFLDCLNWLSSMVFTGLEIQASKHPQVCSKLAFEDILIRY